MLWVKSSKTSVALSGKKGSSTRQFALPEALIINLADLNEINYLQLKGGVEFEI